ncbi:MAG TPA: acyl-CoA dehydrogenase, partial [Alphaproteobacteria bacterium]|nr:acyl-CoA dehydrogenase [Alphaproteobacteria bacterium]HAJ47582.1 acyl-CoA dehydrogenase [Alphaproteobacteria bacterium]
MTAEPEHIQMLRETIRRYVAAHAPREAARDWDKRNYFPRDAFKALAQTGVMGLTIPEE